MSASDFSLFLKFAVGLCLVLTVLNALKYKERPRREWQLSTACFTLAIAVLAFDLGWPTFLSILAGLITAGLLVYDYMVRIAPPPPERKLPPTRRGFDL